jgi:hypothetical protein
MNKLFFILNLVCIAGAISAAADDDSTDSKVLLHVANGSFDNIRSNNDGSLIVASNGESIFVDDMNGLQDDRLLFEQRSVVEPEGIAAMAIALNDKDRFYYASGKGPIKLWDVRAKKVSRIFEGMDNVSWIGSAPEGHLIIKQSVADVYKVWNPSSGEVVQEFAGGGVCLHQGMKLSDVNNMVVLVLAQHERVQIPVRMTLKDFCALSKCFYSRYEKNIFYDVDRPLVIESDLCSQGGGRYTAISYFKEGRKTDTKFNIPYYSPKCYIPALKYLLVAPHTYTQSYLVPISARESPSFKDAEKNRGKLFLYGISKDLDRIAREEECKKAPSLRNLRNFFKRQVDAKDSFDCCDELPYICEKILKEMNDNDEKSGQLTKACRG